MQGIALNLQFNQPTPIDIQIQFPFIASSRLNLASPGLQKQIRKIKMYHVFKKTCMLLRDMSLYAQKV